jgi:hypothetical protein
MAKPIKKIYANKSDSCATIVHKVLSCDQQELILYLPKGAVISETPKNFKLLKREISSAKKEVTVESIDNEILEMASSAGFKILDGLFSRVSPSKVPLMDIMPVKSKIETLAGKLPVEKASEMEPSLVVRGDEPEEEISSDEAEYTELGSQPKKSALKRLISLVIFTGVLGIMGYIGFFALPRAEISIERKKADWSFAGTVVASTKVTEVSDEALTIPAQIFTISKNGVYSFPASGSEIVERKASGKVTIYNAYSSDPQPLVKNTRFVTPSGKVYRIVSGVTVPGAKISEGKIQPSSVETDIVADAPGDSYNTGPVAKLLIPGFQGSPKYDGFYGEFKTNISGGFIGEMKVPTKEDIKKAKEEVTAKVDTALKASIVVTVPPEFKIVENAISYTTTQDGVTSDANEKGEFSYGVVMEAKVPSFKESDLILLMEEKFKEENADSYDLILNNLVYSSNPTANFSSGKISIPIEFSGTWARSFDAEVFRSEISGVSEESLKSAIFAIPGALSAKADLWPFWITRVPKNLDKIKININ